MSAPFSKTKREMMLMFPGKSIVQVYVPVDAGYLQAMGGGKYWTLRSAAEHGKLRIIRR